MSVINYEQLEAEFVTGCHCMKELVVSETTLAHLVMAAQFALRNDALAQPSASVLREFVTDVLTQHKFPSQTRRLIYAGPPPAS